MKVQLVLLVCFACIALEIHGAVFYSEIETEIVYGKKVRFCTYKERRYLPRSVFKDYDDCVKCTCKRNGLQCATIGMRFTVPEDSECDNVLVGCKNRWVLKSDNTKKCPKEKIPQNISAVGK